MASSQLWAVPLAKMSTPARSIAIVTLPVEVSPRITCFYGPTHFTMAVAKPRRTLLKTMKRRGRTGSLRLR